MTEPLKVPEDIAAIIAQKKLAMQNEQEEKAAKEKAEREAAIELGRQLLREKISETLETVPVWLHRYDATEAQWDDDDLERTGRGNDINALTLVFEIPGLAPIQYKSKDGQWRSAQAYEEWNGSTNHPVLRFSNSSYWRGSLEYTLFEAEQEQQAFVELEAKHEELKRQAELRMEEDNRREQEAELRGAENIEQEKSEAEQLFSIFKDDPVAINLLKAFLMIRQERTSFEMQLDDANSSLYSMEERWTRKAAELRRQAEAAERRADEESGRAGDLEDDLSKARKQIKAFQRDW